jgi:hypothetical protein
VTVYIVWDNGDYGSMFSPEQDSIDSVYSVKEAAEQRRDELNSNREKWRTRARITAEVVK